MRLLLVDEFLSRSARLHPHKLALVCGERRLTYGELEGAAVQLAQALQSIGVRRGDRVVMNLENSIEAVISIFGILKAGVVIVPVGPTVKADKLGYILADSEAVALIADERALDVVVSALDRAPDVRFAIVTPGGPSSAQTRSGPQFLSFEALVSGAREAEPTLDSETIDIDLAALVYTSGSTGRPKGVMLTHLNIVAAATSISSYLENTTEDVILNVLPLSFDYGLYQVFLAFKAGARLILERSFVYPTVILELLAREGVTGLPVVPMLAALLLRHDTTQYDIRVRYITNTGAPLPPAHIAALRQRFPGAKLFSMYGLTECKRVSFLAPEEVDERPTSVGKPMDNVEVYVCDESGALRETGVGELVVRGSNVMQGYWRSPDETAAALRPGWLPGEQLLHTGDMFRVDDEGYMYFLGRMDDLIKSRGQRVSPKEVENVIYELPGVIGVAAVGLPDAVLGNFIKVFVCVDGGSMLTEQDVLRHCSQRLEDFMIPRLVEFVASLPTTDTGKIQRRTLAAVHTPPLRA